MLYYKTYYQSPIGKMVIVSDEMNIVGAWFEGQKYYMETIDNEPILNNDLNVLNQAVSWLNRYFNQEQPDLHELPLAPKGSDFRQIVWQQLCQIPYGKITTYGDIATTVAKKMHKQTMANQAIGNAVGHNPISIIIPCHRVIGANGSLTGYAGGIDKKLQLLQLENVAINNDK